VPPWAAKAVSMIESIDRIGRDVLAGRPLQAETIVHLAELAEGDPYELFHWAGRVRRQNFADTVRFCSIVAGRLGACAEDCKWCAQSLAWMPKEGRQAGGRGLDRPRTAPLEEILSAARSAAACGSACIGIVNSGRRPSAPDLAAVINAARQIARDGGPPIGVCASLGELTAEEARQLAQGGVRRYHHNLETSRRFFPSMVTTHSYDDRLATLQAAKAAGMSICCGGIFGLGETWADRAELAVTLRDQVRPDVVPLNFLHAIPGTPLEEREPLRPLEILTIIAAFRLALPTTDLKVAGGRQVNLRELQSWMFYAGATSCMVGNYLTTAGRDVQIDRQLVQDLGLTLVQEFPRPAQ